MEDLLTVVIATKDRREELIGTLARLESLAEDPALIVVDNASRDRSADAVEDRFPQVKVIRCEQDVGAPARNLGVQAAHTPYVAFSDDDSSWQRGSLLRATELFRAEPHLALAAARILVGRERVLDPTSAAMRDSPLPRRRGRRGRPVLGFLACAAAVRRDAFLQAGGFRAGPRFGGEERLLAADLVAQGWDVAYFDELEVTHDPSPLRDKRARTVNIICNDLTFALMRRPRRVAAAVLLRAVRDAAGDDVAREGLSAAARAWKTTLRARRRLPVSVERDLSLLESQGRGTQSSLDIDTA